MNTLNQITPDEFKKLLDNFDWNYEYTDDINVYRKSVQKLSELQSIAAESAELQSVYDEKINSLKNGK